MITIHQMTLRVAQKILFRDFSASIPKGEKIGVFGPNGVGKSTFLEALMGKRAVSPGAILINGHPPQAMQRKMAYLPQELESLPVDYSVMGFLKIMLQGGQWGWPSFWPHAQHCCEAALKLVQAFPLRHQLLSDLSGGERKRVLLAALFLDSPQIVLLDEPLANLDPRFSQTLIRLIMDLQAQMGFTLFVTAHDFNPLVHHLDRLMFIGHEKALLDRPELILRSEVLSNLYDTPLQVLEVKGRKWVFSDENHVFLEGQHCHQGGGCVSV